MLVQETNQVREKTKKDLMLKEETHRREEKKGQQREQEVGHSNSS